VSAAAALDWSRSCVNSVFTDFDSGRTNRIRYDTPRFRGAFASASYGADQKWGVAARWAGAGHGLRATAGAGVQDPSESGVDVVYQGSASVLHEDTGLNLTYATAFQDQNEGTGQLQYIKAGWQHDFFAIGGTAFSIDFGFDKDAPDDGDDGKAIGLVALQNLSDYGTELFAGFRGYDFDDGDGPNTSTIYVATARNL
jgi:Gram-negative porin